MTFWSSETLNLLTFPLLLRTPFFQSSNITLYSPLTTMCVCVWCILTRFSHVQLFETLWTVTHQAPLTAEFSRQEYWSGYLLTQGSNLCLLRLPSWQAGSLPQLAPGKPSIYTFIYLAVRGLSCSVRDLSAAAGGERDPAPAQCWAPGPCICGAESQPPGLPGKSLHIQFLKRPTWGIWEKER